MVNRMQLKFIEKQLKLLNKIGFSFDVKDNLSDEQINEIDKKVSDYFALHGIVENDQLNEVGLVCESIMDLIGEI